MKLHPLFDVLLKKYNEFLSQIIYEWSEKKCFQTVLV